MTASPFPLAAGDPFLVEEEPLDGPRDDAIDNVFIGPPFVFDRIVNAQARSIRRVPQAVDVLRRFAGAARIGADRRIDHEHADVWTVEIPVVEVAPGEVHDPDAIGLTYRAQRPFPHADPAGMRNKTKLRAFGPQFLILFGDRREGASLSHPRDCSAASAAPPSARRPSPARGCCPRAGCGSPCPLCCRRRAGPCTCAPRRAPAVRRKALQGCAAFPPAARRSRSR